MGRILRASGRPSITRQDVVRPGRTSSMSTGLSDDVKHAALGRLAGAGRTLIGDLQFGNLRLLVALSMRGQHFREIGIKNPAGGHIVENIFSAELRHQLAAIDEPVADGIAFAMAVNGDGINRRNGILEPFHLQKIVSRERNRRSHEAACLTRVIYEELLVALALTVTIISA